MLEIWGGTHSVLLNNIARDIWFWCMQRNLWLTAIHIVGIKNLVADTASRQFNDNTEWKLNSQVFQDFLTRWGKPDIDRFAYLQISSSNLMWHGNLIQVQMPMMHLN